MNQKLSYDAVHKLYGEHGRGMLLYACALLGSRAAAEDVVQEIFMKLLSGARMPLEPAPYLFKAVRNTAANFRRATRRNVAIEEQHSWLEAPAGRVEAAIAIESALRGLPDEQREVLVMRAWGELTFDEIATILSISINTAASRYRYGLNRLREIMGATEVGSKYEAK